jgi:hypothetical protein
VKKLATFGSVLVLSGSLGVAALFASSAPSFAAARSYATGRAPISVAMGDLNGDGKPDLATANYEVGVNSVSVLLNSGHGSFRAKRDYRTGRRPSSVAIGDLNGDGRMDLATANEAEGVNTVSVLVNQGDGSFQSKLDYRTGADPNSVAMGDVNGDAKRDLVTANWSDDGSTVSVLLNRGDGSFEPKVDYRTQSGADSVAMGDLNGDGTPDLAIANFGGTVAVLLNTSDGSVQAGRDYRTGGPAESIAIGDLNGDGKPDLATANGNGTVSMLANRGDGSFRARLDYPIGAGNSLVIGDLNGDGKLDLATPNIVTNTVAVLLASSTDACTVPNVRRRTLPAAKRMIARTHCRVGKIRRDYSKTVKRSRVISEYPKPPTVLPNRGKVELVVSRGRRPS